MNKWEDLLKSGLQLEHAGDLSGAEAAYRAAVAADTGNTDVWFRLGVVSLKARKYHAAAATFRYLTTRKPELGEAWSNFGAALASMGKEAEAEEVFRKAVTLCPQRADLWRNLGSVQAALGFREQAIASLQASIEIEPFNSTAIILLSKLLRSAGRRDEAILLLHQSLELRPELYDCCVALAEALSEAGKTEEAVVRLNRARELRPDLPGAYLGLGAICAECGQYGSAETFFRRAIAVDAHSAEAFVNLGNVLRLAERTDEAEASLLEALRLNPQHAGACFNYGILLEQRGALTDAVRYYSIATARNSGRAEHHINLGRALESLGKHEDAIATFGRAAELKPESAEYINTLGCAQVRNGSFDQALASFKRAISVQPNYAEAHYSLATLYLLIGNWSEGWQELEWRWQAENYSNRSFLQPIWGGEPLAGRTILVHSEQGLGDTLQFVRYLAIVQRLGGVVVFECQPALLELLSNCSGIDQIVAAGQPLPDFDLHMPLMSLPRVLRTTASTIPHDVPYIAADPKRVEQWRLRFSTEQVFRIGVVWRGNPKFNRDADRSLKLTIFEPLARLPGVRLISLQKGAATAELQELGGRFAIEDFGSTLDEDCGAFVDTAALMKNLDLVVSIDSSPAHLAGALGVPVWVPLAAACNWRWLLEREDTPWYPTMRLFRQSRPGDWNDVFQRISRAVLPYSSAKASRHELNEFN